MKTEICKRISIRVGIEVPVLLTEKSGKLDKASRILCPYHRWAYSSKGDLLATGSGTPPAGFDATDFGLYSVAIQEWSGFVFINLNADNTTALSDGFDGVFRAFR